MRGLFFALYLKLLIMTLAILMLGALFIQWQQALKVEAQHQALAQLVQPLIEQGYLRQAPSQKDHWLTLVQALLRADIPAPPEHPPTFHQIDEESYQGFAKLLVNELSYQLTQRQHPQQLLHHWQSVLGVNLALVPVSDLKDPDLQAKLRSAEVLMTEAPNPSLYALLGPTGHLLMIEDFYFNPRVSPLLYISVGLVVVLVILLALVLMIYPLERRLHRLAQDIQALTATQVPNLINSDKPDPIADLYNSCHQMARRIHGLVQQQQQLTQAVSHELRTPLAKIQLRLQMMQQHDPKAAWALTQLADGLHQTIDHMLLHAKLRQGWLHFDWQPLEVADIIEDEFYECMNLHEHLSGDLAPLAQGYQLEADAKLLPLALQLVLDWMAAHCQQQLTGHWQNQLGAPTLVLSGDQPLPPLPKDMAITLAQALLQAHQINLTPSSYQLAELHISFPRAQILKFH